MSAGLARNWWAIALRGLATLLLIAALVALPPASVASVVFLFAAYLAADGICAILAATIAARRGERWRMLIVEGLVNLAVVGGVLSWPVVAMVPFLRILSLWAVITGALLLAAAHRLAGPHGRMLLGLAGGISAAWGIVAAAWGPSADDDPRILEIWLAFYAVLFGGTLVALALRLLQRHREAARSAQQFS